MNSLKQSSDNKSVLVIGGGISGLQSAINLAEIGIKVILVEKSPALGGALPLLFRTYPQCACCRIYQKMLEAENHPDIEILTRAEVTGIKKGKEGFFVKILLRPRYVDTSRCISCGECTEACPETVTVSGGFEWGERKAAYLPYPQAIPFAYVIDGENCLYLKDGSCGECKKVCPTDAVRLDDKEDEREVETSNIVVASGFDLPDVSILNKYGYQLPNVVTSVEFERLLSISGPTGGKLLCPGSGEPPKKIAWIQCVGSRDTRRPDTSHCSSVCCMFAIKEAINAKEFLGQSVQTDVFFMDVRAYGKGFEEYAKGAREQNVNFKYTRIHDVLPAAGSDRVEIYFHNHENDLVEKDEYDLVVLSTGLRVSESTRRLLDELSVDLDVSSFAATGGFSPVETSVPGVYVCGSVSAPKDIKDSMMEAGAVAAEIAARRGKLESISREAESGEIPDESRIGIFVCECPLYKISDDKISALMEKLRSRPGVVLAEPIKTLCTDAGKEEFTEKVRENRITRLVMTGCAVTIRRSMFAEAIKKEGLKPEVLEMIDLSEHADDEDGSYGVNIFSLSAAVNNALERLNNVSSMPLRTVRVEPSVLVVGGGISGMEFALAVASQGYHVYLIEREARLGGRYGDFAKTWKGEPVGPYLKDLISRVEKHPDIDIFLESEVIKNEGYKGNFRSVILNRTTQETRVISHGVTHLATGAKEFKPDGYYCYGEHEKVLTLGELERELKRKADELAGTSMVVFIQCVGSRDDKRPYCSRVCCTRAVRSALELKKINPAINIAILHRDIRTYGLKEKLYQEALGAGVFFVRYDPSDAPVVEPDEKGLKLRVKDRVLGSELIFKPDMVVLSTAVVADNSDVSRVFSVDLDDNGFFAESHAKMKPVEFFDDAITMSGSAHGPKFLDESIAQAKAAAASALAILRKQTAEVGGVVAVVERSRCAACCTCVRVCPFDVPQIVDSVSFIDETLCKGCGACVAECPGKAISLVMYEEDALFGQCGTCLK